MLSEACAAIVEEEIAVVSLLEDKEAIRDLCSEYAFRMDDGQFGVDGGVAELFTEDGEWITNYAHGVGREEIRRVLERVNPHRNGGPARKHYVVNSLIRVDGDEATCRASYLVLIDRGSGPEVVVGGTYEDQLAKEGEGWRFRSRMLVHDMAGDLGLR